jgi:hypothetical protein
MIRLPLVVAAYSLIKSLCFDGIETALLSETRQNGPDGSFEDYVYRDGALEDGDARIVKSLLQDGCMRCRTVDVGEKGANTVANIHAALHQGSGLKGGAAEGRRGEEFPERDERAKILHRQNELRGVILDDEGHANAL